MNHDPFPTFEYLTQTQLGEIFGITSHQVGRKLKEAGLRTATNQPSPSAFAGGWVKQVTVDGACTFSTWSKEKVVTLLEQTGHQRKGVGVGDAPSPIPKRTNLVGPFAARKSSKDGYEIVGADGIVSVWVRGGTDADRLVALLNLAHRFGKLG